MNEKDLVEMALVVNKQQKALDISLQKIDVATAELAKEREELANTVETIAKEVGKIASASLINALGDAQKRFNDEMGKTTAQALKSAQDANQELEKAKKTVSEFTRDLKGTMAGEIRRAAIQLTLVFSVIGALSLGGLYGYFLHQASKEQESAEYWIQKGNAAFEKCQKLKSCRD